MKKNVKNRIILGLSIGICIISGFLVYYTNQKLPFECNQKSANYVANMITEVAKSKAIGSGKKYNVCRLYKSKQIGGGVNKKLCLAKTNIGGNYDFVKYELEKKEDGEIILKVNTTRDAAENYFRHYLLDEHEILKNYCE